MTTFDNIDQELGAGKALLLVGKKLEERLAVSGHPRNATAAMKLCLSTMAEVMLLLSEESSAAFDAEETPELKCVCGYPTEVTPPKYSDYSENTGAEKCVAHLANLIQTDPDFVLSGMLSGQAIQDILVALRAGIYEAGALPKMPPDRQSNYLLS